MNRAAQARKSLERDLRRALANGELTLAYQPQVDVQHGTLTGAEALLRWTHPDRGPVPPSEFVPVAEECGLIVPLGEWVLETACRQSRAWQAAGLPPVRVAANLSAAQFLRRDLVASVLRALDVTGLAPEHLELEITEGLLMRDTTGTTATLRRLADLGIRIALDDFGTGYSQHELPEALPGAQDQDRPRVRDGHRRRSGGRGHRSRRYLPRSRPRPHRLWPKAWRRPSRSRGCAPSAATSCKATISAARCRRATSPRASMS